MEVNGSSVPADSESGHLPALFNADPFVFFPYVGLTCLAMVVGFFGNTALLVTLLAQREVQKVGREFMLNMCIADLCVTGFADPLCILAAIKGEEYLAVRPALCTLVASFCLTACFCAFFSLGSITASRMVFICHNRLYKSMFSRRKAIVQCCLCWVLSFSAEAGNFLGWGGHFYDKKGEICAWKRTASASYTYFVGLVLIAFPLALMLLANVKILATIRSTKARLIIANGDSGPNRPGLWRETARACRTLLALIVAFCICWIPYTVVILVDVRNDIVSPRVHLFVSWLAHLHAAVVVCVHLSNGQLRRALLRTFTCGPKWPRSGNPTAATTPAVGGNRPAVNNACSDDNKI